MKDEFADIRAYRVGAFLQIFDWFTLCPLLKYLQHKTTSSLKLDYLGDRKQIEADIRKGACFLTNHRDIVMDASWLSMLLRIRYNIRPYMGMGDNLFGRWWIEGLARFNRVYVVKRGVHAHELLGKSLLLSKYITHLRSKNKSIWLAEREGRAKDSNDRAQGSVIKMLTMYLTSEQVPFFDAVKQLNICPVSISYEYDPCDYLKAQEMQLKRDNPRWRKRAKDDLISMRTGILGQKGNVVFRLTPSINSEIDQLLAAQPELAEAPINEQAQAVCNIIDQHIWAGYEIYQHTAEQTEQYIRSRVDLVDIPNKDEQFLMERIAEMYNNPVINHANSHFPG